MIYCWYDNDISWKDTYGALYNWYAVVDSRELCPDGWHMPSYDEWMILINFLGGEDEAGGKMRSTREEPDAHPRWDSPNTCATNESGFSGLPPGARTDVGPFSGIGAFAFFWSSTESSSDNAWGRDLYNNICYGFLGYNYKRGGYSVRCLRD